MSVARAFDNQTLVSRTFSVPALDVAANYSRLGEGESDKGETAIKNLNGPTSLQELVSFKYEPRNKVTTHRSIKQAYPSLDKRGYQFVVKDQWYERHTEADGSIHDEPVVAYLVVQTTMNSSVQTGEDVASVGMRVVGSLLTQGDSDDPISYVMADRLIHGSTVPADVK